MDGQAHILAGFTTHVIEGPISLVINCKVQQILWAAGKWDVMLLKALSQPTIT